jgi:hypothetical protein
MEVECKSRYYSVKNCCTVLKERGKLKVTEDGTSTIKSFEN